MDPRADYYRLRALEAQRSARRASEEKMRDAFEDVAAGWFMLAELLDSLDAHDPPQSNKNR